MRISTERTCVHTSSACGLRSSAHIRIVPPPQQAMQTCCYLRHRHNHNTLAAATTPTRRQQRTSAKQKENNILRRRNKNNNHSSNKNSHKTGITKCDDYHLHHLLLRHLTIVIVSSISPPSSKLHDHNIGGTTAADTDKNANASADVRCRHVNAPSTHNRRRP